VPPSAPFSTPDLCDRFAAELQVAAPVFRDWGGLSAFAGPIETVRVLEDNPLVRQVLGSPGQGRVLVVDGGGSLRCALVGGNLARLAQVNGWHGIVVYGCLRDTAEIAATPIGVKALAASPTRPGKAGTGVRGVTVVFAGISYTPGHWLYADRDGLVVAGRNLGPA